MPPRKNVAPPYDRGAVQRHNLRNTLRNVLPDKGAHLLYGRRFEQRQVAPFACDLIKALAKRVNVLVGDGEDRHLHCAA